MLDTQSPRWAHAAQNIALIFLSIATIPISGTIALLAYILGSLNHFQVKHDRNEIRSCTGFRPRTILVTGVGMTKGLTLARLFHKAGHNVVGADFDSTSCGRVSRALDKYYRLDAPTAEHGSAPYLESLLEIIFKEKVDLWVSCSGVASAVEDGEAKEIIENRTSCKAIQFDIKTTQMLHEKNSFIEHVQSIGLSAPDTHTITSRGTVNEALAGAPPGRKYIMKPIGVDDAARGDMTLLPKATAEQTVQHLDKLRISKSSPYILQQFVQGDEFCTHALVVRGQVKAFVACPSDELLMHYEALPDDSPLSLAMLRFTKRFTAGGGESFTGHLSFDFLVPDSSPTDPESIKLFPIECNPRAHTAIVLFSDTPAMVNGYLSLLTDDRPRTPPPVVIPYQPGKYYWFGHDLITRLLVPLGLSPIRVMLAKLSEFAVHVFTWRDGTFELWDPMPWVWLYHVYWPLQFARCLRTGMRWSRVNVSTTKMFGC